MKRKYRNWLVISIFLLLLVLAVYFLLAIYYRQGFAFNTWINGVYCTGKSVEEVNSELLSKVEAPIIILKDGSGAEYEIALADAAYQETYTVPLQNFLEEQNPFLWIDNAPIHMNYKLEPQISYDVELLRGLFEALPPIQTELQRWEGFVLACNPKDGYRLYDNLSNRLDVEQAFLEFTAAIDRGERYVDLSQLDCYYDIPLNHEQKQLAALWEKIDAFQKCDIVYDMGEDESLDKWYFTPDVMAGFLKAENGIPVLDENGNLVLDEDAVREDVGYTAECYDTYGKVRKFQSTRGDEITITEGNYGTTIDQEAEVAYLLENLLNPDVHTGKLQYHIPTYEREAYVRGRDDIGGTYIEVDMQEQKLYCYVEHELKLETDVVTGNMRRKMGTPAGIYFVYNKQEDRVLRGPGYASPVDYWMPVKGSIGIHDANWRDEFGGEIYKRNGSHGCVNVPPEMMADLYEMIEIGTPVIMFYE